MYSEELAIALSQRRGHRRRAANPPHERTFAGSTAGFGPDRRSSRRVSTPSPSLPAQAAPSSTGRCRSASSGRRSAGLPRRFPRPRRVPARSRQPTSRSRRPGSRPVTRRRWRWRARACRSPSRGGDRTERPGAGPGGRAGPGRGRDGRADLGAAAQVGQQGTPTGRQGDRPGLREAPCGRRSRGGWPSQGGQGGSARGRACRGGSGQGGRRRDPVIGPRRPIGPARSPPFRRAEADRYSPPGPSPDYRRGRTAPGEGLEGRRPSVSPGAVPARPRPPSRSPPGSSLTVRRPMRARAEVASRKRARRGSRGAARAPARRRLAGRRPSTRREERPPGEGGAGRRASGRP